MPIIKIGEIIKQLSKDVDKDYRKLASKVRPTKFSMFFAENNNVNYSIDLKTKEPIIKPINKLKTDKFIRKSKGFGRMLVKIGFNASELINYIEDDLVYNSNVVKIDKEQAMDYLDCSLATIKRAIKALCDNDVLSKTTIKDEYVINHNFFFYGSIDDFVNIYNTLYKNKTTIVTQTGKIVVDELLDGNNEFETNVIQTFESDEE